MIKTKQDYRDYVAADLSASKKPKAGILKRFTYSETYYIQSYLKTLRNLEYLTNKKKNLIDRCFYLYILWKYKRLSFIMHLNIPPNVAGPGLCIFHLGNIIINSNAKLGSGCSLLPGVVIGQKESVENVPVIGNNVYFGPGSKVIGKVIIGNNVVIAPNSVVIKDIPDNCVVSGVPARVIKQNGIKISQD